MTINDEMLKTFKKYLLEEGTIDDLAFKFYSKLNNISNLGFKDLISSVSSAGVPAANAPTMNSFGVDGLYEALNFSINDYVFLLPFHINHDIKPGGKAYIHVHWSTNGTNVQPIKWRVGVKRSKGHNSQNFGAETVIDLQQAPSGTAWRHMITEVSEGDAITMTEPDELFLVTLKRITNGAVDNTDQIFGLMVDFHYESDRDYTPNKAPNFYA